MQRTTPPRYRPPLKPIQPSEGVTGTFVGRCPHLGTMADAGTALAFASDANHCYRTRLPVPVSNVHQQSYCLSGGYAECPVFQQNLRFKEAAPLVTAAPIWGMPEEETVTNVVIAPARQQQNRRSPVLPLLLLLALLLGGWALWRVVLSEPETAQQGTPNALAIGDETAVPAGAGQSTGAGDSGQIIIATNPTATSVPNTPTPEPVEPASGSGITLPVLPTASSVPPDVVQAAECTTPEWWVPYVVQASDTLSDLAQLRGLVGDDVLQGNCLLSGELVAGQVILLPPLAIVIGLTPIVPQIVATRASNAIGSIVIVATQAPIIVQPSPTPFPTTIPDDGSDEAPTSQPPRPTATAILPTRVPPTATPPVLFPTVTTAPPGPTATPPAGAPTATPPFTGPTQTPPPVRP